MLAQNRAQAAVSGRRRLLLLRETLGGGVHGWKVGAFQETVSPQFQQRSMHVGHRRYRNTRAELSSEVKGETTESDGGGATRGRAPDVQRDSHGQPDCAEFHK